MHLSGASANSNLTNNIYNKYLVYPPHLDGHKGESPSLDALGHRLKWLRAGPHFTRYFIIGANLPDLGIKHPIRIWVENYQGCRPEIVG